MYIFSILRDSSRRTARSRQLGSPPKNEENSDNINRRGIKSLLASDYIETNVFTSLVVAAFTSPHLVGYDWAMVARRSDGSWPSAVGYDWATGAMVITFLRAVAWLSAVGYD